MHVVDLETVEALDRFLSSANGPLLLYKHSATCGRSAFARDELRTLAGNPDGPASVGMIVVQSARRVSNDVARRFAVRHESTRLFKDLQTWVGAAGKDDLLSSADLDTIRAATRVIEGVTLREAQTPDPTAGPTIL